MNVNTDSGMETDCNSRGMESRPRPMMRPPTELISEVRRAQLNRMSSSCTEPFTGKFAGAMESWTCARRPRARRSAAAGHRRATAQPRCLAHISLWPEPYLVKQHGEHDKPGEAREDRSSRSIQCASTRCCRRRAYQTRKTRRTAGSRRCTGTRPWRHSPTCRPRSRHASTCGGTPAPPPFAGHVEPLSPCTSTFDYTQPR